VPTGLEGPHTAKFQVTWTGPPNPHGKTVTYQLRHQPSVAIPLSDGWYGSRVGGEVGSWKGRKEGWGSLPPPQWGGGRGGGGDDRRAAGWYGSRVGPGEFGKANFA